MTWLTMSIFLCLTKILFCFEHEHACMNEIEAAGTRMNHKIETFN